MSGEADYLSKIQVAGIAAYDRVYQALTQSIRLWDVSSAFAMEEPKQFVQDVEDFVKEVWPQAKGSKM